MITKIVLWLLVIFGGIAFGAGVYEARVEVPQWLVAEGSQQVWLADVAKNADPGLRFWAFVTTGPLTLLTIASLVLVWSTKGKLRFWWLVTIAFLVIDRGMTFGYFIPTMANLMSGGVDNVQAVAIASQWAGLNVIRLVAAGLAFVAALQTFAVYHSAKNGKSTT